MTELTFDSPTCSLVPPSSPPTLWGLVLPSVSRRAYVAVVVQRFDVLTRILTVLGASLMLSPEDKPRWTRTGRPTES